MKALLQDLRYAARVLTKNRGFTTVTVLTLALGIGINTAFFSLLDIAFRPLPVRDPEQVVDVTLRRPVSFSEYTHLRDSNRSFSDLVASEAMEIQVDNGGGNEPQSLRMYGRLKPGATSAGARAEMSLLFSQLAPNVDPEVFVRPLGITGTKPEAAQAWLIRGVAMIPFGIVLLISCANIANLALARGTARRKEIGVRMSLGATRRRVVKQLMTESILLAVVGGAAGLLFAWWSLKALLLAEIIPSSPDLPLETIAVYLSPNPRVLIFTALLSLGTTLVFGLVPALRATGENLVTALKDETSLLGRHVGRSTLRNSLVIGQLALCLMLLIATGLLVRGMTHLRKSNPVMQDPHLALAQFNPKLAGYSNENANELHSQFVQRLKATPAVQYVSLATRLPFEKPDRTLVTPDAGDGRSHEASYNAVSSDYFETLGLSLIRGASFTPDQVRAKTPVAVVTESTAKVLWPNQDPLGQKLRIDEDSSALEVVGIAPDVINFQSGQAYPLFLFLPLTAERQRGVAHILLRSTGNAQEILASVRSAGASLDPTLVVNAKTLVSLAANTDEVASARAAMGLAAGLALLALALSAVGLYGVMSYTVSQRTHEVGIRLALGAQRRDILRLIAHQGFRLVGYGLILGIAGGVAVSRVLSALLFGLSPLDPISYISVSLFLAVVAAVAMYVPARGATKVDPIVALRYE